MELNLGGMKVNDEKLDAGSGAGSRGGHVIGKTKSGKPIYQSHNHPAHKELNSSEHQEAANVHDRIAQFARDVPSQTTAKPKHHEAQAAKHRDTAKKKFQAGVQKMGGGKPVGKTPSGKNIYLSHEHSGHDDFTGEDHAHASVKHEKLFSQYKDLAGMQSQLGQKEEAAKSVATANQHEKSRIGHAGRAKDKGTYDFPR